MANIAITQVNVLFDTEMKKPKIFQTFPLKMEELKKLLQDNYSYSSIARHFNCDHSSICYQARKLDYPIKKRRPYNQEEINKMVEDYKQIPNMSIIARQLGCTRNSVRYYLIKTGTPIVGIIKRPRELKDKKERDIKEIIVEKTNKEPKKAHPLLEEKLNHGLPSYADYVKVEEKRKNKSFLDKSTSQLRKVE